MKAMTTKELTRELQTGLKALRMPGIRITFQEAADLARRKSLCFEHFLLTLVEQEQQSRTHRRIQRVLRASRLPLAKTLNTFL